MKRILIIYLILAHQQILPSNQSQNIQTQNESLKSYFDYWKWKYAQTFCSKALEQEKFHIACILGTLCLGQNWQQEIQQNKFLDVKNRTLCCAAKFECVLQIEQILKNKHREVYDFITKK